MRRERRVSRTVRFARSASPFCSGVYGDEVSRVIPFSEMNCWKISLSNSLVLSEWMYATSVLVFVFWNVALIDLKS